MISLLSLLISSNTQGGTQVLKSYSQCHVTALMELYTELALKKEKFCYPKGVVVDFAYFLDLMIEITERKYSQHRKFFDEFAKIKKFDPLDAKKWYTFSRVDIKSAVSISEG
jgi:hypothetical protein